MSLHVSFRKSGERHILVEAAGGLKFWSSVAKMREALDVVIGPYEAVDIDVAGITYMDPVGLELLVLASAAAGVAGTRLNLRRLELSPIGLAERVKLIAAFWGRAEGL